jgi:hypothetical protein
MLHNSSLVGGTTKQSHSIASVAKQIIVACLTTKPGGLPLHSLTEPTITR